MNNMKKLALITCICLIGCRTTEKCDAYSIKGYDYIQIVDYTDIIPTYGEEELHLPPGKYIIKAWKGNEVTYKKIKY
jgi:hypothetical protein